MQNSHTWQGLVDFPGAGSNAHALSAKSLQSPGRQPSRFLPEPDPGVVWDGGGSPTLTIRAGSAGRGDQGAPKGAWTRSKGSEVDIEGQTWQVTPHFPRKPAS